MFQDLVASSNLNLKSSLNLNLNTVGHAKYGLWALEENPLGTHHCWIELTFAGVCMQDMNEQLKRSEVLEERVTAKNDRVHDRVHGVYQGLRKSTS